MTIQELKQALADAEALLARETANADAGSVTAQQACFYALAEKQRIEAELQERFAYEKKLASRRERYLNAPMLGGSWASRERNM